jgi:hypothetical protein
MVEVTAGSVAVSPTSLTPVAPTLPPPGLDATARTERATRPAQPSQEGGNDRGGRVIEDKIDLRNAESDEEVEERQARRRGDKERFLVDDTVERQREEEAIEQSKARDRHSVDFTA